MPKLRGFTLIELLIVVTIIAVLSAIGYAVYSGLTRNARDPRRRADIDSIAKAYEVRYDKSGQTAYSNPADADFSTGKIPIPPEGGNYYSVTDGSGFKACAKLEGFPGIDPYCNYPSQYCFCKSSAQGRIPPDTPPGSLQGTGSEIGLGPTTCISSLSQNLVGYWKMDEGSGTNVTDSSGNSQALRLNSSFNWTTGKLSSAIRNPTGAGGSLIDDSSLLEGMSSLTISAWVYPTQLSWSDRTIFNKGQWNQADMSYRLMYQTEWNNPTGCQTAGPGGRSNCPNGYWLFNIRTNVGQWWIGPASSPSDVDPKINKWHLVTGVYTGAAGMLYYDGVQIAINNSASGTINTNAYPVSIGNGFIGNIDDVRIYNKALSPQEVSALYNNDNGCIPQ